MLRYVRGMFQLGLVVLAIWAVPTRLEAQGTVLFANNVLQAPPDRRVYWEFGGALTGTNYFAQLYYSRTNSSSWVAVTNQPATFRPSTTALPGTWIGGHRTLFGVTPGDTVLMQVWVWDSVDGQFQTREEAYAAGVPLSVSAIFQYTVPPSPAPPGSDHMVGFAGFTGVSPALRLVSVSRSAAEFRFYVQGDGYVAVEHTTNLVGTQSWTRVPSKLAPFWFTNTIGADRRFFRARKLY